MFPIGRKGNSQDKGRKRPLLRSHLLPIGTSRDLPDAANTASTGMATATAPSAVASDLSSSMFVRKAVPLRYGTAPNTGVSSVHRSNTVPAHAVSSRAPSVHPDKERSKSAEMAAAVAGIRPTPPPGRRLLPVPAHTPAPVRSHSRVQPQTPRIDFLPQKNPLRRAATDTWDTRTSTQLSTMRSSSFGSVQRTEDDEDNDNDNSNDNDDDDDEDSDTTPQPTPIANKYLNTAVPLGDVATAVAPNKNANSNPGFDIKFSSPTFDPKNSSTEKDVEKGEGGEDDADGNESTDDKNEVEMASRTANIHSAQPTFSSNPEYLWELEDFQKRRDERNNNARHLIRKTEDEKRHAERRNKLLLVICCVLAAVLIGITVGMTSTIHRLERSNQKQGLVNQNKQHNDTQRTDGGMLPIGIDTLTDAAKLASILSDTSLHNVLYGIGYSPQNVMTSQCGVNQTEVTLDVAALSRVTKRIRLYGTSCDQALYVLRAIDSLKVDMKVTLGVWINGNPVVCAAQIAEAITAAEQFPHLIESIMVGNEVFFRGELAPAELVGYMHEVRTELQLRNLTIPVGTSELGSQWSPYMASNVDILGANIHPFFGGLEVSEATTWTLNFLESFVVNEITEAEKIPQIVISEIGWPSGGGQHGAAKSGVAQQQRLLQDWVCTAKDLPQIGWYWFEAFDEPWKRVFDTPTEKWESQWGILTPDRRLKKGLSLKISCN
ncbi:glycoside hydrolase superfamily [Yarrowia lipolytica]|uniref:glucan endo-1,3-beta-D-glucosidase n=1 Tax=Yarrowia lipolytica TaxID=4952 RepID=A0A371C865_YARLL|nr:glycoside hydrolase superfamily [Yarrowia lipolytica]